MPDQESKPTPAKRKESILGKKITLEAYANSVKKATTVQNMQIASSVMGRPVGTSHWENMMKKFSRANKEVCRKLPEELESSMRDEKDFPTGSSYVGSWNELGMSGKGTYKFPNSEVIYTGEFEDGMFHGDGELKYESGVIIKGKWYKGKLVEKTLIFDDGLEYAEQEWQYLRPEDRRYTAEINDGIPPAGRSNITAQMPPPEIPPGCYDAGDGYYEPVTKLIYDYSPTHAIDTKIIRSVNKREQDWIKVNCRPNPQPSVGPCHFFYEKWEQLSLERPVAPPPPTPTYRWQPEMYGQSQSRTIWTNYATSVPSLSQFCRNTSKFDLRTSSAPNRAEIPSMAEVAMSTEDLP